MSWAVRAWKDSDESAGISIGIRFPVGWDNQVAEIILAEYELLGFFVECATAIDRAKNTTEHQLDEPMPGAYESWDHE